MLIQTALHGHQEANALRILGICWSIARRVVINVVVEVQAAVTPAVGVILVHQRVQTLDRQETEVMVYNYKYS